MFFDPHPLRVLAADRAPSQLTMPSRRAELLEAAGADHVVIQPFDDAFSRRSPEAFVDEWLVRDHGARAVVVGPDFRFGHRRAGDVERLRELGASRGFVVDPVPPVEHRGAPVSSSRIRACLSRGAIEEANDLMLRTHEVEGRVVTGDRRGRTLGYPTANLDCDPVLLPDDGVYAVVVRRLDDPSAPLYGGAASLGLRPTFEGAGRSFEVFLWDFEGDLYGVRLRVGFVQRIRPEEKFDDVEALKARMAQDVTEARRAVAEARQEQLAWI
jgi:riboflavin kinase/FMN adenylyltransferase